MSLHLIGHEKTEHCFVDFNFSFFERRNDDGSLDSFVCDVQPSSGTQVNPAPWRFERVTVVYVDNMKLPLWKPYGFTVGKVMSEAAAHMEALFQQAMAERVTEEILR